MKKLLPLLFATLSVSACGIMKPKVIVEVRDSIRTEIRDHWIHDSVEVKVPEYIEKVITRDTASHLENKFAVSDAVISNGFLSHSLATKPGATITAPVDIHYTDTLIVEKAAEIRTETVEVERELTHWQMLKMRTGGLFIGFWIVCFVLVVIYFLFNPKFFKL